MSEEVAIREVTTDVWTFSRPFTLMRWLPVGGRSTAVKLSNGDVWYFVSTPLTEGTKETLAKLGPVRYLVAPNIHHNLFLPKYAAAYPEAKVIGPQGLLEQYKKDGVEVQFTGLYGTSTRPTFGYEDELDARCFTGYKNQDIAFLHKASGTLIEGDLVFNLPGTEQYSRTQLSSHVPLFGTFRPVDRVHQWFTWFTITDKAKMSYDVKAVAAWEFDRIIPCHGDVIETGGKAAWATAFTSYM